MPTSPIKAIEVLHEILRMREIRLTPGGQENLEDLVEPLLQQEDPLSCGFLIDKNAYIELWFPRLVRQPHIDQDFLYQMAGTWQVERPMALYYLWDGTKWWEASRETFVLYIYYEMKLEGRPPTHFRF